MTENEFRGLLHPSEASRYALALFVVLPLTALGILVVFGTMGIALLLVPLILFMSWFATGITRARFLGSAVRVSDVNFPEIYQALLDAKQQRICGRFSKPCRCLPHD